MGWATRPGAGIQREINMEGMRRVVIAMLTACAVFLSVAIGLSILKASGVIWGRMRWLIKKYIKNCEASLAPTTIKTYKTLINQFSERVNKNFNDLNKGDIENYIETYVKAKSSKEAFKKFIKSFYKWYY